MCPCNANNNSSSSRVRLPTPQNIQNALIHIHTPTQAATVLYQTQAGLYIECLNHSFLFFIFGILIPIRYISCFANVDCRSILAWYERYNTLAILDVNLFRTFIFFFSFFLFSFTFLCGFICNAQLLLHYVAGCGSLICSFLTLFLFLASI